MRKMTRFTCLASVGLILVTILAFVQAPVDAAETSTVDRLTVSGGSIGGTSNLSANALAAIIFKYCGTPTSITANSTFTQVTVLQSKEANISTAVGYQALDAYKGAWKGDPYPDLRTLFQSNSQVYHYFVLKGSPIQGFMDLKGKRVVVGKKGFFAEDMTKRIHTALGLEYGKFFTPVNIGHSDASAALINGKVDAYVVMSNFPQPEAMELTESHPCKVLGLTKDEINKVVGKFPDLIRVTIPAGTYKGMDSDAETLIGWMFYSCDKKLPDDLAYCTTKNFFENLDHAAIHYAELKKYNLKDTEKFISAPYHKGALRYFKEKGLKVQDSMIPPEAK